MVNRQLLEQLHSANVHTISIYARNGEAFNNEEDTASKDRLFAK